MTARSEPGTPTEQSWSRHPPRSRQDRTPTRPGRTQPIPPPKHTGSSGRSPLLPEGHRALPNRKCRRPEVLRARSSSSELPAPGSGSKTRERSPARVPPCCWLVSGRDLVAHFRPLSGTTREDTSRAGFIRTAFQRRPEAWRRRPRPRRLRPPPWPEGVFRALTLLSLSVSRAVAQRTNAASVLGAKTRQG